MISNKREKLIIFFLTGLVGALGYLNVQVAFLFTIAALASLLFSQKPLYCLGTFILIAPFSHTAIFNQQLAGIPGVKIPNLLLILSLFVYLISKKSLKIKKADVCFLTGIALLLSFSVFRSIPDIGMINYLTNDDLNTKRYVLSYLIRPLTYLIPFFLTAGYIQSDKDINSIVNLLIVSTAILSLFLILIYAGYVPNRINFVSVRNTIAIFMNTHSNNIANVYILVFPLVLARYFYKKDIYIISVIILSLLGVGLLFSRTAYALLPASAILMLFMSNKKRFIPVAVGIGLLVVLISPSTIKERSMHGFVEGDLNQISAGRIERIWIPLLNELKRNPETMLIGKGRHSVILSGATEENHAHNMYLGVFFETGIIGCLFFAVYFLSLLRHFGKYAMGTPRSHHHLILQGIFVSIVVYLTSGVTGRHIFPYMGNLFLWIIIGLGLSIIRNHIPARTSYEK